MIKRRCKKAGISKRVYPNLFRHTEATELANHLTEAQMKARHGWTPYSKMPGRYVHLNNSYVEEAILSQYGLSNKKEEQKQKLPKFCSRCDTHNAHDADICMKCATPLDVKTAMMQEEKLKRDKDLLEGKIEQLRAEFNQKLENIERQRNTRTSAFTNVISDISDDSAREFLSTMYYLFELINPEETKQSMWKKFAKYRCKPLTQEILDSDFAEERKIGIERMKLLFNQS